MSVGGPYIFLNKGCVERPLTLYTFEDSGHSVLLLHCYCCLFSSSNMASSSSVRLASMFPISFRTSADSARGLFRATACCLLGVGDGCGGRDVLGFTGEYSTGLPLARVLMVPAFSLAKGSESDSVLELD